MADPAFMAELDPGIAPVVRLLWEHGIQTIESCQGGPGHAWSTPVVFFAGDDHAGLWAVWLLEQAGIRVSRLARTWELDFGCPRSPYWKVILPPQPDAETYEVWPQLDPVHD